MIKCLGCGSSLLFDPATQLLKCPHCGRTENVSDFTDSYPHYLEAEQDPYDPNMTHQVKTYDALLYKCPNCGAEIVATDETASTFCSFCGDSVVLTPRLERQKYPAYIIPFSKTKADCEDAYKKKLKSAFFAPSRLKKENEIEKFRGIYMPYWTYDFSKNREISVEGKKSHRSGNYVYTDHYRLRKPVHAGYEGASFDAASTFNDTLSEAISPFNVTEAKEFTPAYLSGFYADVGDVAQETYAEDAKALAADYFKDNVLKDSAFRGYEISDKALDNQLSPEEKAQKMGYFPVWFLAVRSRNNKRVSYAVVNGQTGKVAADLPVSFWKYLIGSLLVAVPIFLLLNFFFTLTPVKALLISAFLSLVSMIIVNMQANRTYTREHDLDDRGLQSIRKKEAFERLEEERLQAKKDGSAPAAAKPAGQDKKTDKKKKSSSSILSTIIVVIVMIAGILLLYEMPWILEGGVFFGFLIVGVFSLIAFISSAVKKKTKGSRRRKSNVSKAPMKEKVLTLLKPIAGILIALITWLVNPVQDIYYYAASSVIMALITWSIYDIISQHNRQTMRPLPQFGKRGGK